MRNISSKRGFTLVELLVVITIIGVLISLLLPAVQAAREAARRAQCNNNLKQIGLACLNCESALKHFPNGGWHALFVGNPDCGNGLRQTGCWMFNILPYMEQSGIYNLQAGKSGSNLQAAAATMLQTPVSCFYCPSRRQAKAYPRLSTLDTSEASWAAEQNGYLGGDARNVGVCDQSLATGTNVTYAFSDTVARNDYAGNSNGYVQGMNTFQPTMNYPDCVYLGFGTKANTTASLLWRDTTDDRGKYPTNNPYYGPACGKGGIFFSYSMVAIDDIHDGTSNTICVGEKYLRPDFYENGAAHGDCWSCWIGYDTCNGRCVERRNVPVPAVRDTWGYYVAGAFGSPHAGGCNYVMCDGSVRQISYGCDGQVFMNLGNRNDGNQIDPAGLSM